MTTKCLDNTQISDLLAGRVSNAQEAKIIEHLDHCAFCRSHLEKNARLDENAETVQVGQDGNKQTRDALHQALNHLACNPPQGPLNGPLPPLAAAIPNEIGKYRILEKIGEGGMGVVYKAEQPSPKRIVAVKTAHATAHRSTLAVRLFQREAEALGTLQHPGIAQIYESGVTPDGTPYFVMEFVEGLPIDQYADQQGLTIDKRVALMIKVCQAVNYAHQRGIIHRDLKPSNILVNGQGEPKVLDFGLARLTDPSTGQARSTMVSQAGHVMGTLQYMSPEQTLADPQQIDTRTDVYSLGVILYELLTGQLPYQVEGMLQAALAQIRETAAKPPSTIMRRLRGDLEIVVLRTLNKDRDRRYQSAVLVADDLEHVLQNEPIIAKRDSLGYVLRKRIRRHWIPVSAAAIVVVVLLASALYTFVRTRAERDRAEIERANAVAARDQATIEAAKVRAINHYIITGMFESADPTQARGQDTTVREVLDEAMANLEPLVNQPVVEADVRNTMSRIYLALGIYGSAAENGRHAMELRKRVLGDQHPETIDAINSLALALNAQGNYQQAEQLLIDALETQRALPLKGLAQLSMYTTMNNLALVMNNLDKHEEAEQLHRRVLKVVRRLSNDPKALISMSNLAYGLIRQGRYQEAENIYRQVLDDRLAQDEKHPATLRSMNSLAGALFTQGKSREAEALYRRALALQNEVLKGDHLHTIQTKNNLAMLLVEQDALDEAELLLRDVIEFRTRRFGQDHAQTRGASEMLRQVQSRKSEALVDAAHVTSTDTDQELIGELLVK